VIETALVTGAYGFVGRHVAMALAAEGVQVTGIGHGSWDRSEWRQWGVDVWHSGDVTPETLATYGGTPDLVIHCAGSGTVAYSLSHPAQDFQRTVTTSLAVLEFMRQSAPRARLCLPSSAAVYGRIEDVPQRVSSPAHPVSPYGVHKKIVEDLCRSYAHHFQLSIALVRLFSIFGKGLRKQLMWDACQKLSRSDATFAGTGLETRDWLHVNDAASLLLVAARAATPACITVNGGTGSPIAIRVVIEALAAALGTEAAIAFTGAARPGDPAHYQADIAQALALGWQPRHDVMAEIANYAHWYRREQA
jgi:UDP-glucose 4-epimerase